jgi:pimeloyl-ACP methyl ester carboxylesterase
MPLPVKRAYIDNIYGQLHYRIAEPAGKPTRPPLLLLHQTPKSGWEYEPIMPGLAADRVVIAPDTPGYGASDPPPAPVTIGDYAAAFARLMDDLGMDGAPFDVMGTHTGSVTATQMAVAYPGRVRKIILLGLPAYDAKARKTKLENLGNYPRPKAGLSHIESIWTVMAGLADPRATPEWRHGSLVENLRSGARMPWGYAAVYKYDLIENLAQVTQPAMVINPEDDLSHITPKASALLKNGRRVDLPGVKHGLFALDTEKIVALVRDFLDEPDH